MFVSPLVYIQSLEELECNLVKLVISSGRERETTFCRRNSPRSKLQTGADTNQLDQQKHCSYKTFTETKIVTTICQSFIPAFGKKCPRRDK